MIRARVVRAAALTAVAVAGGVFVVAWAHGLTGRQRTGGDAAYAIAFVIWALLLIACLAAWTAAALAVARRLDLPRPAIRFQAVIACAAAAGMTVMTAATVTWWVAMAHAAPWFLAGGRVGTHPSPVVPELLGTVALMLVATLLGLAGARQAHVAQRMLRR